MSPALEEVSAKLQASVTRRWQLASRRRLLQIAYKIGPSEGVQRDGNEAGPTLHIRSARTSLKSGLQYVGEKISTSLDPLINGWLASDLQQTPT